MTLFRPWPSFFAMTSFDVYCSYWGFEKGLPSGKKFGQKLLSPGRSDRFYVSCFVLFCFSSFWQLTYMLVLLLEFITFLRVEMQCWDIECSQFTLSKTWIHALRAVVPKVPYSWSPFWCRGTSFLHTCRTISISSSRLGLQPNLATPALAPWSPSRANTPCWASWVMKSAVSTGLSISSVITVRYETASAVLCNWDEGFHGSSLYYF